MKPASFSEPRDIFSNEFVRLYSVRASFGRYDKEYFVTDKGTRVGVLLLRDDRVLLVRQYRFLIDDYSWEIPGGGVAPAESLQQAAARECREEAGVVCRSLTPLFAYRLGLDTTDARVHLFRSVDFGETGDGGDGRETDARKWVPVADCLRRITTGELKDLMTIVALLVDGRGRAA